MIDKDTANYINSFFASLTKDFPVVDDKWLAYGEMESLPTITKKSVAKKLRKLKPNKAPGLNDPNVKILKYSRSILQYPWLKSLTNLSDLNVFLPSGKIFGFHLSQNVYLALVLTNYVLLHLLVLYRNFKSRM